MDTSGWRFAAGSQQITRQEPCGLICYTAFRAIADAHHFLHDFPAADVVVGLMRMLIEHPGFHGVIAERDGTILGSNVMDERPVIRGIGPVTVDPGRIGFCLRSTGRTP